MRLHPWARPLLGAVLALVFCAPMKADEIPARYRPTVDKGLQWLKSQGIRSGDEVRWEARQGEDNVSLTAPAGLAFLMEGSTLKEGKYRTEVRGAAKWLM